MSYGILLWGYAAGIQPIFVGVQPIFVLQKRAIRAIYNLGPKDSYTSQYIFENVMYVKKIIYDFTKIGDVHNINTRNRLKLSALVTLLHRIRNFFIGQCVRFYKVFV